ncbi:MAG: GAF domain-containing protein [Planctomycetota bacterium]
MIEDPPPPFPPPPDDKPFAGNPFAADLASGSSFEQDLATDAPAIDPAAIPAPTATASDEDDPAALAKFMSYIEDIYHSEPERAPGASAPAATEEPAEAEEPPDPTTAGARSQSEIEQPRARWWPQTLTELAVLFGLLLAGELWLRGGRVGMVGFQPHPYWIIVLSMAAGRGTIAGLLAALAASTLYFAGVWQETAVSNPLLLFSLDALGEPVAFLAMGFLIGEFRDELAQRHAKLWKKYERLQEVLHNLRREHDLLVEANQELKRRFVDHSTQFGNMIDTAVMIETATDEDIYNLALDMVSEHCGASACSVLLVLEDGGIDLATQVGWEEDVTRQRLEEAEASPQVRRAIESAERVNGLNSTECAPQTGPLVVAPIADGDGQVGALLCLDELPASRFNESTVSTFFGIAGWIAASLKRISRGESPFDLRATINELANPAPWLGTREDLGSRVRVEDARCSRLGINSSVLALQTVQRPPTSAAERGRVDRWFQDNVTKSLRLSDTLFRFGYPGCYLLVLTGTPLEGATIVQQRLSRRLSFLDDPSIGEIEVQVFGPDDENPDLGRLLPRIAEHFRERAPMALEARCPVAVPRDMGVGDLAAFVRRLRMEIAIAQRYDRDLHVLDLQVPSPKGDAAGVVARHIRQVADSVLRATDGVFLAGKHRVAVILPGSNPAQAERVLERLGKTVRERIPQHRVDSFSPQLLGLDEGNSALLLDSFLTAEAGSEATP